MNSRSTRPSADHLVHDRVVERDVGAGLELAVDVGVVGDPVAPRVDVDDLRAAAPRLLEEGRRDRVVRGRVAAGEDRDVGVHDVAVGRGDRARADALEQRRDARGVAQPGAVVDVVGAEAGADQLLEEVGLLVGALGRAEAGDARPGRARRGSRAAARDQVERLVPASPRGSAAAPRRSRPGRRACACAAAAPSPRTSPDSGPFG